jgi:hypothetical protein
MNIFTSEEKINFEAEVDLCFAFMATQLGMKRGKIRVSGGNDPRDSILIIRYSRDDLKVDIGWQPNQDVLIVVVRFDLHEKLSSQERRVNFEPFIEFLSGGEIKAIVPCFTEGMSIKQIKSVAAEGKKVFRHGLHEVIAAIGEKLKTHFCEIESVSPETVRRYHSWMKSK